MSESPAVSTAAEIARTTGGIFRLWVDGAGAYLVCCQNRVGIGGPGGNPDTRAEISLLSNLSGQHARFIRSGEVWLLEALSATWLDGRPVTKHVVLNDGQQIRLGANVELKFRLPSPLSGTARLDFESSHQTRPAVDGVILMAETCVLSPGSDSHIRTMSGSERVLLVRRTTGLWCRSESSVQVNGIDQSQEVLCQPNQVYAGTGWQFRLE